MHWQRLALMRRPRPSQLLAAVSAVVFAASTLVTAPAGAQSSNGTAPVLVVDPNASITFTGNGWGHGVGMSQWGTYARAQAGQTAPEILSFYYPGAELVENYGRPDSDPAPTPQPTPVPTPTTPPTSTGLPPPMPDSIRVVLATTDTTMLTPEGLNRITVDDKNIAVGNQDVARAPAQAPIAFSRADGQWRITYNGIDICPTGCAGDTAQLHFGTDTAVAVSTTGRSYSHGRFNLVATTQDPNRFHITLDSLTTEKYLTDPHNSPGPADPEDELPEGSSRIVLATATTASLTPEGLNRISVANADIGTGGQPLRAPANAAITFTRANGRWHIVYNGIDACPSGCAGETAQLHFGTGTAVAVSNTGRSYSHGRINLVATPQDPNRFHITLDSLTAENFLADPHNNPIPIADPPDTTGQVIEPPPTPVHPEDAMRIHLSTTTSTTLTPGGLNRITIDGQGEIRVPAATPVTIIRHAGHWHITYHGADVCGSGCAGQTAQLHFATGTSVGVSNTGRSYSHGRINLVPAGGDPSEFYVILDSLSMEDYLRGIAETPMNWALVPHEVQAIAARSYASATLRERRASASWTRPFDLYSTVWDQAFVGDTREKHASATTWLQAVTNTAGRVLFHQGAPIRAFYSSSNGGHTERSGYVFHTDLPYLAAVPDQFDAHQDNPNASWSRTYSVQMFNQWLNDHPDTAVGHLIGMEVVGNVGASGRMDKAQLRITGTSRTVTVTGTRLQSRINTAAQDSRQPQLLSTKFTFSVPSATHPLDPSQQPPSGQTPIPDDKFYSGVITGPDFCLNRSLGGPTTYAFDSDGDGIADICSLPRTRRDAAARQQAMEDMALLPGFRDDFNAHLGEECLSVPETFGEPDKEAADLCQQYRMLATNAPGTTASQPQPQQAAPTSHIVNGDSSDPAGNGLFYSGVINSSEFCLTFSLGGPRTYAFDSNSDGIADTCSLPRTRREAAARQRALERLAKENPDGFTILFQIACIKGPKTLGESGEATDECQQVRQDPPA